MLDPCILFFVKNIIFLTIMLFFEPRIIFTFLQPPRREEDRTNLRMKIFVGLEVEAGCNDLHGEGEERKMFNAKALFLKQRSDNSVAKHRSYNNSQYRKPPITSSWSKRQQLDVEDLPCVNLLRSFLQRLTPFVWDTKCPSCWSKYEVRISDSP